MTFIVEPTTAGPQVIEPDISEPQVVQVAPADPNAASSERRRRAIEPIIQSWRQACEGLNTASTTDVTSINHHVSISVDSNERIGTHTVYSVSVDAPRTLAFSLKRRASGTAGFGEGIGDARFDKAVVVKTDNQAALINFLTHERRSMILQLLLRMPTAEITNATVTAWSKGVDQHPAKVQRTMSRLIEVADVIRPSWVDAALDERSVLHDLFDADRDLDGISARFDDLYFGNSVSWSGEVLQVGEVDPAGRRVAIFVGTADGRTSATGRVVALAAMDPEVKVIEGDVVTVTGALWNLDPKKRLFRIG